MPLKIGDTITVPVQFNANLENYSLGRHEVRVYVGYHGYNRNTSFIGKETFEDMAQSLRGSPIVGEWDKKTGDFKSHGEKIVIESDSIKHEKNVHAYGYVDSQATISWEKVKHSNMETKEYLVTTGYLWTEYFEEAKRVLDGNNNQSMEIKIDDGYFDEDTGVFYITKATFMALCILGENVEPAFEKAKISSNSPVSGLDTSMFELAKKHNEIMLERVKLYEKEEELRLENKIKDLEAKIEELNKTIEELESKNDKLEEEVGEYEKKSEDSKEKEEEFAKKLEDAENLISKLKEYKLTKEREEKTNAVNEVLEEFNADKLVENDVMTQKDFDLFVEKAIDEMEIIDLKKELSFMYVENKLNFSLDNASDIKVNQNQKNQSTNVGVYGELESYIK